MSITKKDLNQLRVNIKKDFQKVYKKIDGAKSEFRGEMQSLKTELRKEIKEEVQKGVDVLRVLIEDVRSDIKFGFEARDPHEDYTYTKDRIR